VNRAVAHLVISAGAIAFGLVAVAGWWHPVYCLACWIILAAAVEVGAAQTVRWAALPFVIVAGVGTAAYGARMATILIGTAGVIHGVVAAVAARSRQPKADPECHHQTGDLATRSQRAHPGPDRCQRDSAATASSANARTDVSACSTSAACTTTRLRTSPLASSRVHRPALCSDSSQ
jgi:hypothetical protein